MTPTSDTLLDIIAAHLDALRARADKLERIGLASGARWLRAAADELEAKVAEPEDDGDA